MAGGEAAHQNVVEAGNAGALSDDIYLFAYH